MTQALAPLGSVGPLLVALVLISLAIGLPILIVLAIRLLWDRQLSLGRSRELDKLVWQLHRVASALEAAQQAATVPVQQTPVQAVAQRPASAPVAQTAAPPAAAAQAPAPVAVNPTSPAPANPAPGAPTGTEQPTKAGVNSMFGF
jgi:hypothetical protein